MKIKKALEIGEIVTGLLSLLVLVGNFVVGSKEEKIQIGCDDNGNKQN